MPDKIEITSKGIKSQLKRLKFTENLFFRSIAEYISNGFDAKATTVNVNYEFGGEGNLRKLEISDNGTGINHRELTTKFKPILYPLHKGETFISGNRNIIRCVPLKKRCKLFSLNKS